MCDERRVSIGLEVEVGVALVFADDEGDGVEEGGGAEEEECPGHCVRWFG
jgi:hypothetical protein